MQTTAPVVTQDIERLRYLADSLDCLTEEDFQLLTATEVDTPKAWRRRMQGPDYILVGNRVLYPRKAVSKFLESRIRERSTSMGKEALL